MQIFILSDLHCFVISVWNRNHIIPPSSSVPRMTLVNYILMKSLRHCFLIPSVSVLAAWTVAVGAYLTEDTWERLACLLAQALTNQLFRSCQDSSAWRDLTCPQQTGCETQTDQQQQIISTSPQSFFHFRKCLKSWNIASLLTTAKWDFPVAVKGIQSINSIQLCCACSASKTLIKLEGFFFQH